RMRLALPNLLKSRRAWIITAVMVLALWIPTAYPRGMLMAHLEYACGHYEIQDAGYPVEWRREYHQLLRERYNVNLNRVADCVVWPNTKWFMDGYNSVSEPKLIRKYGKDIFNECAASAERRWKREHPEQWERMHSN